MLQLVIVSGRSGSGKSTALHVLEDLDYYCIDNLPISLVAPLVQRIREDGSRKQIAVSIDARNVLSDLQNFPAWISGLDRTDLKIQIVYLDSVSATLVKRYSETRRKHPLSSRERGLREALELEKTMLEPVSDLADLYIDTTNLTLHELRDLIRSRVAEREYGLALLFESFAFKNGVPVDADLVFDVRCLPNPHWKIELRDQTGRDPAVAEFLETQPDCIAMFRDIRGFLEAWLKKFEANNRSYMTIAIGCTGGQHRSVYFAEKLHEHFLPTWPGAQLRHRELVRTLT